LVTKNITRNDELIVSSKTCNGVIKKTLIFMY